MRIIILAAITVAMFGIATNIVPAASANTVSTYTAIAGSFGAVSVNEGARDLAKALNEAGNNRAQLEDALKTVKPEHKKAMEFLIVNMPEHDLKCLTKDFLVENVELAYKARKEMSWGKDIPEELFLNYVLPYANITERRDNWRKDFYDRFRGIVKDCKTMEEAVLKLNKDVPEILNVQYHATKRRKPNQSPYESIEASYASCSGLAIMIADACRAVCIPARFVGVLCWADKPENHCWTEVWAHQWRYIGAAEPNDLDVAWFTERSTKIDPNKPEHRVYAISFERTGQYYPPEWRYASRHVFAEDVTVFYTSRRIVKLDLTNGNGKASKAKVTLRLDDKIVAEKIVDGSCSFIIAGGLSYDADITDLKSSKTVTKKINVLDQENQTISLSMSY